MDLYATSSYPSTMYDENSVYPRLETLFTFKPYVNDV